MKHKFEWTIGTIIAILGLLVAVGFFNSSNIIVVRQSLDYTCPNVPSISDYSINNKFEIIFQNEGNKDASLCVSLDSPNKNVTFTKKEDCLYIPTDKQVSFKLKINPESYSKLDNLTINYNYLYDKNKFKKENHTFSCYYNKTEFSSLQLGSEKQLN